MEFRKFSVCLKKGMCRFDVVSLVLKYTLNTIP